MTRYTAAGGVRVRDDRIWEVLGVTQSSSGESGSNPSRGDQPKKGDSTTGLRRRRGYAFGVVGLIAGIFGLAAALAKPHLVEAIEPPSRPVVQPEQQKLSDTLAEAGEKFVDRMADRVRRRTTAPAAAETPEVVVEPAEPAHEAPPMKWEHRVAIAATGLGLLGLVGGTAGWIRRENHRLAGSAITLGLLAISWQYIAMGIVLAVGVFVLLLLLRHFGELLS